MFDLDTISPMLCETLHKDELDTLEAGWIAEKKYDGTRILFAVGSKLIIVNRRKEEKLFQFPEFQDIRNWLNCKECILDCELTVSGDFGLLASRDHLMNEFKIRLMSKKYPATLHVFDIIWLDGKDLTKLPLMERKEILKKVVKEDQRIKLVKFQDDPRELFLKMMEAGEEGIIIKKKDSPYVFKRSKDWMKVKREQIMIVPVLGWNEKKGDSYGSIQTPIGDVGLLSFKNKDLLDHLVKKFGYGNFKVKVRFMELSEKSGHARFPIFMKFVTKDDK